MRAHFGDSGCELFDASPLSPQSLLRAVWSRSDIPLKIMARALANGSMPPDRRPGHWQLRARYPPNSQAVGMVVVALGPVLRTFVDKRPRRRRLASGLGTLERTGRPNVPIRR
jgi:hypothetical protein